MEDEGGGMERMWWRKKGGEMKRSDVKRMW